MGWCVYRVAVAVGHCIHLQKWRWEFGAKNPKLSCYSLVSGIPIVQFTYVPLTLCRQQFCQNFLNFTLLQEARFYSEKHTGMIYENECERSEQQILAFLALFYTNFKARHTQSQAL